MPKRLARRDLLRHLMALSASAAMLGLPGCSEKPAPESPPAQGNETAAPPGKPISTGLPSISSVETPATPTAAPESAYLAVARGSNADPAELTRRAIAALGGIERFVKPHTDVIVKPNICNAYHGPEYASTTNPDVVAAIVALCLGAGASRVRVMDLPFGGTAQASYASSGIADAVARAGGRTEVMSRMRYRNIDIPEGRTVKRWDVYGDILDADVVINVPIAKTHGSTRLTLGMKNLMGVIRERGGFHARGLHQCIADLNTVVRPALTVVDAVRILMANGPTGGNLDDVARRDTVIASPDIVAADAYAATLFDMRGADIGYIKLGAEMGIGRMDLESIHIVEIAV